MTIFGVGWTLRRKLEVHVRESDSILDIGCGIRPLADLRFNNPMLCVDIYPPYLDRIKRDKLTLLWDARKPLDCFIDQSYDVVALFDIIEHLDKETAVSLIFQAQSIARRKVVVFTPDGFLPQDSDAWKMGGDEFQKHRSGFKLNELQDLGFKCQTIPVPEDHQHPSHEAIFGVWTR